MALQLKNLRKSFGPLAVVDDVSLDVASGEIVVFVRDNEKEKFRIACRCSG